MTSGDSPNLPLDTIIQGHVLDILRSLPDESVNCCITSPPYWGLRDYKLEPIIWDGDPNCIHEWIEERIAAPNSSGGPSQKQDSNRGSRASEYHDRAFYSNICSKCGAWRGSLGLEPTPKLYVQHIVEVFREVKRALRSDGTFWLNMGDSYATGKCGRGDQDRNTRNTDGRNPDNASDTGAPFFAQRTCPEGLKPKDLVGIPWMVAFALRADGWYLRSDIIWSKPNPMPESVTDRPTKAHEYVFLLAKSEKYHFDQDAVREPHQVTSSERVKYAESLRDIGRSDPAHAGQKRWHVKEVSLNPAGRNIRSVWNIPTQPFRDAHFATFPERLVEPMIKAGCPVDGVVLDPFIGSGTVGVVAKKLARHFIGIELSPEYVKIAEGRLRPYLEQRVLA